MVFIDEYIFLFIGMTEMLKFLRKENSNFNHPSEIVILTFHQKYIWNLLGERERETERGEGA
jgi:hypothetical protein